MRLPHVGKCAVSSLQSVLEKFRELEHELKALQSLGIESFQGFYFFRPMPSDKFLSMVKQNYS